VEAQRSADAAQEIKTLISTSTQQVGAGVALVGQTGEALQRIVFQVASIDTLVSQIAARAPTPRPRPNTGVRRGGSSAALAVKEDWNEF